MNAAVLDGPSVRVLPSRGAYLRSDPMRPRIEYGRGAYLYDAAGRDYLDAGCGSGSLILGHGDEALADLLAVQARQLSLFPGRHMTCQVVEDYAAALTEFGSGDLSRALFYSSGSDAVEAAIKLAIHYQYRVGAPKRHKIIGRRGSYHGNSLAGLAAGGFIRRRRPYEAALARTSKAAAACLHCAPGAHHPCECAASIEKAILAEGPDSVAAVILEPVVGAALSASVPGQTYLSQVQAICRRHGVLLIADEVMTGFARTGRNFAMQHWDVTPDILVMGKAMSAGYFPLSGILVGQRIAEAFESATEPFQNAQTNACNPVACRIGLHVLEQIARDGLEARALVVGEGLRTNIRQQISSPWLGEVRGLGMMIGVELGGASRVPPPGLADTLQKLAQRRGLLIYASNGSAESEAGEHFLLLPPLNIATSDSDCLVTRLRLAFEDLDHLLPAIASNLGAVE